MSQKIGKEMMIASFGSNLTPPGRSGDLLYIESTGMSSICTVSPQSKATAIPMPLGAACLSAPVSTGWG